jgi:hypothetical protein
VQDLVLQQAECALDVLFVGLAQPPIQPAKKLPQDRLVFGLEVLRKPADHRTVSPPGQIREKGLRLLSDDGFGATDVLAPFLQCPFADTTQVVDVKQTGGVAVVERVIIGSTRLASVIRRKS